MIVRYAGASLGSIGGTVSAGTGSATGYTLHTFNSSSNLDMSGVNMNARLSATLAGIVVGSGGLIYNGPGALLRNAPVFPHRFWKLPPLM